jgi:hypothetical protein
LCYASRSEKFVFFLGDPELEFSKLPIATSSSAPALVAPSRIGAADAKAAKNSGLAKKVGRFFGMSFGSSSKSDAPVLPASTGSQRAIASASLPNLAATDRLAPPNAPQVLLKISSAFMSAYFSIDPLKTTEFINDLFDARRLLTGSSSGNMPALRVTDIPAVTLLSSSPAPSSPRGGGVPSPAMLMSSDSADDGLIRSRSSSVSGEMAWHPFLNPRRARKSERKESAFFSPALKAIGKQLDAPFSLEMLVGHPRGFPAEFLTINIDTTSKWGEYFALNGRGLSIRQTPGLRQLVLQGIPNELRCELWLFFSGAAYHSTVQPQLYIEIDKALRSPKTGPRIREELRESIEQIDKDLMRMVGGHAVFAAGTEESSPIPWENHRCIAAIRRVLISHCYRNRAVGYTQGMHEIVGLLLLLMPEAEAFYLLAALCESILPVHYSTTSFGALAEMDILLEYVQLLFPDVVAHLSSPQYSEDLLGMKVLECYLIKWVFSLFTHGANCVSFALVFRIWDWLFFEGFGSTVLLQCTLAILDIMRPALLATSSEEDLAPLFQDTVLEPGLVIEIAASKYAQIADPERIAELRNYYQVKRVVLLSRDQLSSSAGSEPPPPPPLLTPLDFLLPGSRSLLESAPPAPPLRSKFTSHSYHVTLPSERSSSTQSIEVPPPIQLKFEPSENESLKRQSSMSSNFQPFALIEEVERTLVPKAGKQSVVPSSSIRRIAYIFNRAPSASNDLQDLLRESQPSIPPILAASVAAAATTDPQPE